MVIKRRQVLQGIGAAGMLALAGFPGVSVARLPMDKRMILMILRGGMDGLAAVPPVDERAYGEQRKQLALSRDQVLPLGGVFGLHPALAALEPYYRKQELAIFHAVASPYRERSHFDAQNVLENGTHRPQGVYDGWMNRLLGVYAGAESVNYQMGLAVGKQVPLVLQGSQQVASWSPRSRYRDNDDFMEQVMALYAYDAQLGDTLREGMSLRHMTAGMEGGGSQQVQAARVVSDLLQRQDGARFVVMEMGGWDTHARQGAENGMLANNLNQLASILDTLAKSLQPIWKDTVITVVTEFGRTVEVNGTDGTDHGTASVAFMMGGAVHGGNVYGKWPGLSERQLYQGRDLMPTTDMFAIFKTILQQHLKLDSYAMNTVFPNSGNVPPLYGMIG